MEESPDYPSSIFSVFKFFKELNPLLEQRHLKEIRKTPFKLLAMAFRNNSFVRADGKAPHKFTSDVVKVLSQYDNVLKKFRIGTEEVQITAIDIAVFFGIPDHPIRKDNEANDPDLSETEWNLFLKKYFEDGKKIRLLDIKNALKKELKKKTHKAAKHVSVLVCAAICVGLFFPNVDRCFPKFTFKSLFVDMKDCNWAHSIAVYLTDVLGQNDMKRVGGCTISLLFWLLEISNRVPLKEATNDVIPRVLKWDLLQVHSEISLMNLATLEINTTLELSDAEINIINGDIDELEVSGTNVDDMCDNVAIDYGEDENENEDVGGGGGGGEDEDVVSAAVGGGGDLQNMIPGLSPEPSPRHEPSPRRDPTPPIRRYNTRLLKVINYKGMLKGKFSGHGKKCSH